MAKKASQQKADLYKAIKGGWWRTFDASGRREGRTPVRVEHIPAEGDRVAAIRIGSDAPLPADEFTVSHNGNRITHFVGWYADREPMS